MLDFRETTRGSFEAWGTGFNYQYNNKNNTLTVHHNNTERLLAQFKLNQFLSEEPMTYVGFLEKACQINALMVSNNRTTNLTEIIDTRHVGSLITSIGNLSRHAYDLHNQHLKIFCDRFAEECCLKSVNIKPFMADDKDNAFFIARVQTHHDNSVRVRACSIEGILAALSHSTIRDLITLEFAHRYEGSAQNLLNASAKLSSLSFILDQNFDPEMRVIDDIKDNNEVLTT
ncbi:MAG: hypothetical protein AB8B83_09770 [Bdellovibrionales bacterium]